jgi:hypothetical protein
LRCASGHFEFRKRRFSTISAANPCGRYEGNSRLSGRSAQSDVHDPVQT